MTHVNACEHAKVPLHLQGGVSDPFYIRVQFFFSFLTNLKVYGKFWIVNSKLGRVLKKRVSGFDSQKPG